MGSLSPSPRVVADPFASPGLCAEHTGAPPSGQHVSAPSLTATSTALPPSPPLPALPPTHSQ